jgi:hypothetical protein
LAAFDGLDEQHILGRCAAVLTEGNDDKLPGRTSILARWRGLYLLVRPFFPRGDGLENGIRDVAGWEGLLPVVDSHGLVHGVALLVIV